MKAETTKTKGSTPARRAARGDRRNGKGLEPASSRQQAAAGRTETLTETPFVPAQVKLAKVKANIADKPIGDAVAAFYKHKQMMVGNANFPTPEPPVAEYDAALSTLTRDMTLVDECKAALADAYVQRNRALAEMTNIFNLRAGYVEVTSGGDESKILTSGMEVRRSPVKTGKLAAPQGLRVDRSATVAGRLEATWGLVKKCRMFLLQYSEADTDARNWNHQVASTKRRVEVNDLIGGRKYAFRVCALGGSTGQSDWSAETLVLAPN